MLRFLILILLPFFSTHSWCQINRDSLVGKYLNEDWIGGGFTGGPYGECISLPPDYTINNVITIDPNLVVFKISDTTQHYGLVKSFLDWGCDTLYIGKAAINADTVVVTYIRKLTCPKSFFHINTTEKSERYKILKQPIIEKYVVWIDEGRFLGLICWKDGWEKNYYKQDDTQTD